MNYEKGHTITFVDLDETLFRTFAKVHVLKNGSIVKKLSNQEFNTYVLEDGESFDFTNFKDSQLFKNTSIPIPETLNLVKNLLNKIAHDKGSRVIVLTARQDFQDKETFLKTFSDLGIDVTNKNAFYIDRVGNLKINESVANKKKMRISHYLSSGTYKYCTLIDDDRANINAFLELKDDYVDSPSEFKALLVRDESLVEVNKKLHF